MGYLEERNQRKLGLAPKLEFKKKPKPIAKMSVKKAAELKIIKGSESELDLFFDAMINKCSGKCFFCNGDTTIKDGQFWEEKDREKMKRAAIAHLLPKAHFKSVAVHESNWVELCWNCHHDFDSGKISWLLLKDSKEWETLKEQLLLVLPMVSPEEQKHKLYSKLISLVYSTK